MLIPTQAKNIWGAVKDRHGFSDFESLYGRKTPNCKHFENRVGGFLD